MQELIECIKVFFDKGSADELSRYMIGRTIDEAAAHMDRDAARSEAASKALVEQRAYEHAAVEAARAERLRSIATRVRRLCALRARAVEKCAYGQIEEGDAIRVLSTRERGYVLSVEQHGESMAYYTVAVFEEGDGWNVGTQFRKDIELDVLPQ